MNRSRWRICFFVLLALLLGGFSVTFCSTIVYARKAAAGKRLLDAKKKLHREIIALDPSPNRASLALLEADIESRRARVESLESRLLPRGNRIGFSDLGSQDLYFEVVSFVEQTKELFRGQKISVKENEGFSFGALILSGEGPSEEEVEVVARQLQLVETVLNALRAAGPSGVIEVRRGALPGAHRDASSGRFERGGSEDHFNFDERLTAWNPGTFENVAVGIGFYGQTGVLRRLLRDLAHSAEALLVRGVEVGPRNRGSSVARQTPKILSPFGFHGEGVDTSIGTGKIPIVSDNVSDFFVTVEYSHLPHSRAPQSGQEYSDALPESKSVIPIAWTAPRRQSWDERAVFEIFTPPIIYFDQGTESFTLEPPSPLEESESSFGIELSRILRRPYRIQYEGFVGEEENYTILLRDESTGLGLRGRVSDHFEDEGISVVSFEVRPRLHLTEDRERTPTLVEEVKVTIYDERLKEEVELGRERVLGKEPEAVFTETGIKGREISVKEGETFQLNENTYTLRKIDLVKSSATVEKSLSKARRWKPRSCSPPTKYQVPASYLFPSTGPRSVLLPIRQERH